MILVAVVLLLLPAGYMGAYFAMLVHNDLYNGPEYRFGGDAARAFFWLADEIVRTFADLVF